MPGSYPRQRGLIRQWKLLRALEASRRGLTWAQLAEAAEEPVHKRTLMRDVDTLTLAGFPIDVRTGRGCGDLSVIKIVKDVH